MGYGGRMWPLIYDALYRCYLLQRLGVIVETGWVMVMGDVTKRGGGGR